MTLRTLVNKPNVASSGEAQKFVDYVKSLETADGQPLDVLVAIYYSGALYRAERNAGSSSDGVAVDDKPRLMAHASNLTSDGWNLSTERGVMSLIRSDPYFKATATPGKKHRLNFYCYYSSSATELEGPVNKKGIFAMALSSHKPIKGANTQVRKGPCVVIAYDFQLLSDSIQAELEEALTHNVIALKLVEDYTFIVNQLLEVLNAFQPTSGEHVAPIEGAVALYIPATSARKDSTKQQEADDEIFEASSDSDIQEPLEHSESTTPVFGQQEPLEATTLASSSSVRDFPVLHGCRDPLGPLDVDKTSISTFSQRELGLNHLESTSDDHLQMSPGKLETAKNLHIESNFEQHKLIPIAEAIDRGEISEKQTANSDSEQTKSSEQEYEDWINSVINL